MLGIFLDIETTGLNPFKHVPIEVAFTILNLSSGHLIAHYSSVIKQSREIWDQRDTNSIEVNGFTWEEVTNGKEPNIVGQEITSLLSSLNGIQRGSAVFICQNPSFDRSFFNQLVDVYTQESLNWPYHWLDFASMYWALHVSQLRQLSISFPEKISLSKNDIATTYNLPIEATPHRAMNGVEHLISCYQLVVGFQNAR